MSDSLFVFTYFCYGLAFFSLGVVVMMAGNRVSEPRLRRGLTQLSAFGLGQGFCDWMEMASRILPHFNLDMGNPFFYGIRLTIQAFAFLSLAAFGSTLLIRDSFPRRFSLLVSFGLTIIWGVGLFKIHGSYPLNQLTAVANVWTCYCLAIPASLLAAGGLLRQQGVFTRAGWTGVGRNALWAALSFACYGLVGQLFVPKSALPPSTFLNATYFYDHFGFRIQLFRMLTALAATYFIARFLRTAQEAEDARINSDHVTRLEDSQEHELQRGELFREVVVAQETERQRVARDLHDETGQALTAIGLGLRGLATTIRRGDDEQSMATLHQLEGLASKSLTELQRLIADLRPSHLDDLGLPATLRWYGGQIKERSGVEVLVKAGGQERKVDSAINVALFRIAQEAIHNIVKHAQATQVHILINFEPEELRLRIRDDGSGFDVAAALNKKRGRIALGLIGMRERASLLGGSFLISPMPGGGTLVEVKVPAPRRAGEG